MKMTEQEADKICDDYIYMTQGALSIKSLNVLTDAFVRSSYYRELKNETNKKNEDRSAGHVGPSAPVADD